MKIPLVAEMIKTAKNSIEELKNRIDNVKYGQIENNQNTILFNFDGEPQKGILRGRNRDLILGFGVEPDKAIACRVLLDGDLI